MSRPDRVAKELVAASLELHRRRSWTRVPADAPFLIRIPDEEEALAGVLFGQDGVELGFLVVEGPHALDQMRQAFLEGPESDGADECSVLSVGFDRFGAIPPELRGVLEAAGFQTRRESIAPYLFAKPAHRQGRALRRREMRTLATCLAGVFAAEDRGELRPATYGGRKILQLEVRGGRRPEVTTRFVKVPKRVVATPMILPADLRELPRVRARWVVGLTSLPARIEGEERSVRAVLIVDEESGRILDTEVVLGGDREHAAAALVGVLRRLGRPYVLVFTSGTFLEQVRTGLAAVGIPTLLDTEEPQWSEAAAGLTMRMAEDLGADLDDDAPEGPTSLEQWKEAELLVTHRIVADLVDRDLLTLRAINRYFGSEEQSAQVQSELAQLGVTPAFLEWAAADYRPTRRSRTYVEKQLERKRLEPFERTLLEARRDAVLSFFRVISCEPGASLEVEDLLCDRRFTVQDRAMSTMPLEGWNIALRLVRVGDWYFPLAAGPPLGPFQIDRVLDLLERVVTPLEPEALRREAHVLGAVWCWLLAQRSRPVSLQNTDGDPLVSQTARFRVADPAAFVSAVERRDDVIVDEPGAAWTWVRAGGPGAFGDTTTLARLELFDDALLAHVNSERRLERARAWLDTLPGVDYLGVRAQRIDPDEPQERPLDDRLGPPPAPLSPELVAELEGHMERHALRWIDEPVPALGHLTPRAACATEEGRRRVARMIRTMPGMRIPGGEIPVPRERVRRELGL